jgi:hypothetical protein
MTTCNDRGQPSNRVPRAPSGWLRFFRPALLALTLVLAAALLIVPNAQAGLVFPPPQTLSPQGTDPTVAVDSQDRATVAWRRLESIQSVRLGADSTPGEVSAFPQATVGPQVALDPSGAATVVWERDGCVPASVLTCVQAVHVDAQGDPGEVQTLSHFDTPQRDPDFGGPGDGPDVAVESQGRATVVWRHVDFASGSTVQAMRLGAGGEPGAVRTLSGPGAGDPKVAIDSQDRATVVWPRLIGQEEINRRIEAVRLGADGTPGPVKTLIKRRDNDSPQVAVDRRGRATVVWAQRFRPRKIQAVRLDAGGSPGAVKTLSKGSFSPQVAVDPRGRATVVWQRRRLTKRALVSRVQSIRIGPDGSRGAVQTLSTRGVSRAGEAQVAVDRRGRATVVWAYSQRPDLGTPRIQARRLPRRGALEAIRTLSEPGENAFSPQIAVDSEGRPTVVWYTGDAVQSTRGDSR